jgi:DoxX-like family
MNRTQLYYWIFTGLFAALMLFTSIPEILMDPQGVDFMKSLGYPEYIIPFIGWAKIIGLVCLFIPNYPRVREWAYAGLFIDLVGATYSQIASAGFNKGIFFMLLPIVFGIVSYQLYHQMKTM